VIEQFFRRLCSRWASISFSPRWNAAH
jgi:hypothetical protein